MKTMEEIYREIRESQDLSKAISEIRDMAALEAFLQEHGYEVTADEFAKYIRSLSEGEIRDDAAASAAGGYREVKMIYIPQTP